MRHPSPRGTSNLRDCDRLYTVTCGRVARPTSEAVGYYGPLKAQNNHKTMAKSYRIDQQLYGRRLHTYTLAVVKHLDMASPTRRPTDVNRFIRYYGSPTVLHWHLNQRNLTWSSDREVQVTDKGIDSLAAAPQHAFAAEQLAKALASGEKRDLPPAFKDVTLARID